MRKYMIVAIFLIMISISGCESIFSNVYGWDLTACYNHMSVCYELYSDNADPLEWLTGQDAN